MIKTLVKYSKITLPNAHFKTLFFFSNNRGGFAAENDYEDKFEV